MLSAPGRKTLENANSKVAVLFAEKRVDRALGSTARARAVRAMCFALGVWRSDVLAMRDRPYEWTDLRKSPPGHVYFRFKESDVRWCSDVLML
jgi:hypothetical protein